MTVPPDPRVTLTGPVPYVAVYPGGALVTRRQYDPGVMPEKETVPLEFVVPDATRDPLHEPLYNPTVALASPFSPVWRVAFPFMS